MHWHGDHMESRVRQPQTLPDYVETDDIDKLKEAMRSEKTHNGVIERNIPIIELIDDTGLGVPG